MTDIYKKHRAAFKNVSAYAILKDGVPKATISFKFPKDGAGRLWVYVHWHGLEMVRGYAGGYGYDKKSAAVENAIATLLKSYEGEKTETDLELIAFIKALKNTGGLSWHSALREAGFIPFCVV